MARKAKEQPTPEVEPNTAEQAEASAGNDRNCGKECTGPDGVCPNLLPDFGCKLDGEATEAERDGEKPDFLANLPDPCVYCGPSVKNVARQYTTYQGGGIPDALREFIKAHPAARGLITSAGKFAAMRKRLETPGTAEAILYKTVKSEL